MSDSRLIRISWLSQPGDDVEESGLAGAVGADQAVDLALVDLDAHVRQGLQPAEALGHALHIENNIGHGAPSLSGGPSPARPQPCRVRATATGRAGAPA